MFKNVGEKIKNLAEGFCWIGILISVIGGMGLMAAEQILMGIIVAVAGSLGSWIGSLAMYALGSLEDNLAILTEIACEKELKKNQDDPV